MAGLRSNTIVIGFTGSIGSGCSYIAKNIKEEYKYDLFSLSDLLREIAQQDNLTDSSVIMLQKYGNALRQKNYPGFLAVRLLESIKDRRKPVGDVVLIDSIRNDYEVQVFKQFPYFYLFSIHADQAIRCARTVKIKKFSSEEEFYEADLRDQAEDFVFGQQVGKCNDLADVIINNNTDHLYAAKGNKRKFVRDIVDRYIQLIQDRQNQALSPEHPPKDDETFMTMAYVESQRSSCLKRKVGAVVTSTINAVRNSEDNAITNTIYVLSSGHNEVPPGTIPCIFDPNLQKCYRDHLQEEQAAKYHFCPKCGTKIGLPTTKCSNTNCDFTTSEYLKVCPKCKREIHVKYVCSNARCGTRVFKEYLLGGGKLLDMCKALHAEENALMNLVRMPELHSASDLTLYTTTYPCNLCANKIVTAGIKKVVYADPYPMEEAKRILEAGGVTTVKFEGIKSSAFFKLYRC